MEIKPKKTALSEKKLHLMADEGIINQVFHLLTDSLSCLWVHIELKPS